MQQTMKAVRQHNYGDRSVLTYEDALIPTPASDDVLIRVRAAGINPVDWKVREGYLKAMIDYPLPLILGWDVAGEIVATGAQVSNWTAGDAVYSRPDIARNGAYAEYIVVRANEIARKPTSLDWQSAAAVPLAALTAWQALFQFANLQAGEKVLIHAGSGGVGGFAIQLAKWRGAEVYTTTSGKNADYVRSIGADHVIDYTQQSFTDLRDMDVVFDTLGGDALDGSWVTLKDGGRLVSIVSSELQNPAAEARGIQSHFCFVQPNSEQLTQIGELIDTGKIKVEIDSVFPLADAAKAHERSESGRARGKIILQVA